MGGPGSLKLNWITLGSCQLVQWIVACSFRILHILWFTTMHAFSGDSTEIIFSLSTLSLLSLLSLQAVSVGKHVKGYHYIIANLVRSLSLMHWLFLCEMYCKSVGVLIRPRYTRWVLQTMSVSLALEPTLSLWDIYLLTTTLTFSFLQRKGGATEKALSPPPPSPVLMVRSIWSRNFRVSSCHF